MVRPRWSSRSSLLICAILAGCGQAGGSPAPVIGSADSPSWHVTPDKTASKAGLYVVYEVSGKGEGGGSWHAHGKDNDCSGDVTAWAATGSFYVDAKTGELYTKSAAPPSISISYKLDGTCSNGESGPSYTSAGYTFQSGEVKRPDPPSHLSVINLKGEANLSDVSGSATLSGPACFATLATSTYREGDAQTYVEIYNQELKPVATHNACD